MYETIILLILGLVGLCVGADFFVKGAKNIALHLGISQLLLGLAFISIGTSIPEIAVSITGGLDRLAGLETSGIVVGNKIGSALSQIGLLFGLLVTLVQVKFKHKKRLFIKQGFFLVGSVVLVYLLSLDGFLSQLDGLICILSYLGYYVFLWKTYPKSKPKRHESRPLFKNIIVTFSGLALVLTTSDVVVKNGVALAESLGVHQSLIGILLIGIGTGLPELSVVIAAIRRRAIALSMGDLIGSNICDILLSLGSGTVISGFLVDKVNLWFDFPVLLGLSVLMFYFFYSQKGVSRKEGIMLLTIFFIYATVKVFVTG